MEQSNSWYNWYSQLSDTYTSQQRKNWYSEAADAYNRVRPRYPKELIRRVVELAQLSSEALILEVGCGPGTATTAFAEFGFSMVCLEPSPESCKLARQNCTQYPKVEILNTTFEEWELEPERFNAVLAATSFHWVSPKIGFPKASEALKESGSLIALWNTALQPSYEVSQVLNEVYQLEAPSLAHYKERKTEEEELRIFGQNVINSGHFHGLVSEQLVGEATYSIDDYLTLLSTYSPYIALQQQNRNSLFEGLREALERIGDRNIHLSYLSAFHIAKKIRV
jgi:SAM-dependent methyltransferase